MMNLERIEAFLAIIKLGSFSKAAEQLFISQPTISNRLQALERDLNVTLIQRQKGIRTITPTYYGELFLPIAEQWLSLHNDTKNIRDRQQIIELNVGCPNTLMTCFLPKLFNTLLTMHPPISLKLYTYQSEQILQGLSNREIDIGLGFYPVYHKNILVTPIYEENFFLIQNVINGSVTATVHPLSLDREKEIYTYWCPEFEQWHDSIWNPNTTRPHIEIDSASLIRHFIIGSSHWSIVPFCVATAFEYDPQLEILHIEKGPPKRKCYLFIHRYPTPHRLKGIEIFRSELMNFCDKQTWDIKT